MEPERYSLVKWPVLFFKRHSNMQIKQPFIEAKRDGCFILNSNALLAIFWNTFLRLIAKEQQIVRCKAIRLSLNTYLVRRDGQKIDRKKSSSNSTSSPCCIQLKCIDWTNHQGKLKWTSTMFREDVGSNKLCADDTGYILKLEKHILNYLACLAMEKVLLFFAQVKEYTYLPVAKAEIQVWCSEFFFFLNIPHC